MKSDDEAGEDSERKGEYMRTYLGEIFLGGWIF